MTTTRYAIELEPGVWLAEGVGDPPRTLSINNAIRYKTKRGANSALYRARGYRPFEQARIVPVKCEVDDEA